ncbi:hypothetical protein R3P38DRAFT_1466981 [Favolaschia claudopus]|uniref:Uncharacterized protein n=1 Tax=Favolaschia claudopus TaxID=2862362 RepID=A0AAW0DT76_9AGAR
MKPHSQNSHSANFMKLYNSLPPEARQSLVEKKLAPLLDVVNKERSRKVIKCVNRLQTKYSGMPTLDLKGKKKELYGLLDELARDSKRAVVRERSNRDEILGEIVDSMLGWLNDVWTVVYEYNVHFEEAHSCLLFITEVLTTLSSIPGMGGHCKCTINYLSFNLAIRRKGKVIKRFNLSGPPNIDRALLWIWRELFVCMLATDNHTEKIPSMLSDIEETLGWQSLERLLYGGYRVRSPYLDDEDDDGDEEEEDDENEFLDDMDDECLEDDEDVDDEEGGWRCRCRLHANHWSPNINNQRIQLRDLIYQHLLVLFELTPSHKLFMSIMSVSPDPQETESRLFKSVSMIAGTSADSLVAALDIHGSEGHAREVMTLLDEHAYLLRPRDARVLQTAVSVLSEIPSFHPRAIQIAEKEILDAAAAVQAAARVAFHRVEEKIHVEGLTEILKLRSDNPQRRSRINSWVDSVVTPTSGASHPMAFAAMIMGFPLGAAMEDGDEMDMLNFLDTDPRDPDFDDLRDEFRPKLRERFDEWTSTVNTIKGGNVLLGKLYYKIVEQMPYLKSTDLVEEMINRLGDRPSKTHLADGLDSLLSFCKTQRKKLNARAEKRRKTQTTKKSAGTSTSSASTPAPPPPPLPHSFGFSFLAPSTPHTPPAPGGIDDVD